MRKIIIAAALCAGIGIVGATAIAARPTLPQYDPPAAALQKAKTRLQQYALAGYRAVASQSHSAYGEYLNYSGRVYRDPPALIPLDKGGVKLDENGFPLVKRPNHPEFYFNPVTHSQFALSEHARGLEGKPSIFIQAAAKLAEEQSADGAFRYQLPFKHYTLSEPYKPGWISGLAQGQALSVFARAYQMTGDQTFKDAGDKALDFLLTPKEQGGPATTLADLDPSLSDYVFFEEYVTEPDVYTLNGFVFILLGLYDWREATGSEVAAETFAEGVKSLSLLLPLYEVGGFSAYDLSHMTVKRESYEGRGIPHMSAHYHPLHIQLLLALDSITEEKIFGETAERWRRSAEG